MAAAHARRSLAGALDVFEDDGMNRLRTVVDRFRHSNPDAEGCAPARISRRVFVRSEARPHVAELSGVKGAGSAVGLVDTGIVAGGVLTSVWWAARLVSRTVLVVGATVKNEAAGRGARGNERLTTG